MNILHDVLHYSFLVYFASKGPKKVYGECVLILEQNISSFPDLDKLTHRLTFGIIYFLKI